MDEQVLPIRGHHLLCMLGFRGLGYSDGFVRNMKQIVKRVMGDPETALLLTTGCDAICRACPYQEDGHCAKPKKGRRRPGDADQALLSRIGCAPNTRTTAGEVYQRIGLHVDTADLGGRFCTECEWLERGFCVAGLAALKRSRRRPHESVPPGVEQ